MQVPGEWYNIVADLPVPLPPLIDPPGVEGDSRIGRLARVLPSGVIDQEYTLERYIRIPEELRSLYSRVGRPTMMVRAEGLERALGLGGRVRIYYKAEGFLPSGSHKINTALAQVYMASMDGARIVATETGAGQWGLAVAMAASIMGLEPVIFMTRSSYESKRARRLLMEALGARVYPSPSPATRAGRRALESGGDHPGSLGLAIAEAVEYVLGDPENRKYVAGSALESALIHQTIIGLEAMRQLPEEPDYLVACVGGGSNFAGFTYPFIGAMLRGEGYERTRFVAAESASVPKLSRGEYRYDGLDSELELPMAKMYTLGRRFIPPRLHAAGLRYHGAAPTLSLLARLGIVEARAYTQEEVARAIAVFSRSEGVVPAPETAHAISAVMEIASRSRGDTVVAFNLSGTGLLDTDALESLGLGGGRVGA